MFSILTLQIQHSSSNPILAWEMWRHFYIVSRLIEIPILTCCTLSSAAVGISKYFSAHSILMSVGANCNNICPDWERGFAQLVVRSVATDVLTTPVVPRGDGTKHFLLVRGTLSCSLIGWLLPGPNIIMVTITTFSWPRAGDISRCQGQPIRG